MHMPLYDRAVVGDDKHFKRNHHHRQQRAEYHGTSRETQTGKGECTEDRRECTNRHRTDHHEQ